MFASLNIVILATGRQQEDQLIVHIVLSYRVHAPLVQSDDSRLRIRT